jgi:uncharacterized protein YdhG (YjbR/CyaY superfamily)
MADDPVQSYLDALDEPARSTLGTVRDSILQLRPDAQPCLSYGAPAFTVEGKVIAGLAASKGHLSYLPHSGSVLESLADEVAGYERSKGALRFPLDTPLPKALIHELLEARLREIGLDRRPRRGARPSG